MKKGKTKRIATLVLVGTLAMQSGVFAAERWEVDNATNIQQESIQPRFIAIKGTSCELTINSSIVNCYGKTEVSSGYSAKTTVTLQKKGSSWSDVKSWTVTNVTKAIVDEDYAVTSGTYRLKVTHYAMSGNTEVESYTSYSTEVTK